MSKFKCVSINATLECTEVSGTTTFVKKTNIVKVEGVELATTENIDIEPFTEKCGKGCLSSGTPCKPLLEGWSFVATYKKVNGKTLLIEKSINKCLNKEGFITIKDVKQDIVVIDFSELLLNAIDRLNELLDKRLDQYENDPDAFKACFEKWFGKGHKPNNAQEIILNRMKKTRQFTSNLVNSDGSLNDRHFVFVNEPDDYGTNAYVYSDDENHKIHLAPGFFSENKPTDGFGTHSGTLGHELSHFKDIGGTKDHEYWEDVQPLAKTDPDKALYNAASFSFFLESGDACKDY